LPLFETPVFMPCRSRRVSSAFVSRPLVAAFGTATDDLRGAAIADFGVSGWIAVLRGSGPDLEEDDPILEFCADAMQTTAATATNKKAILHRIIGNLRFPLARLITTHFRSRVCPKVTRKSYMLGRSRRLRTKRKAEWLNKRVVWTEGIEKEQIVLFFLS
jgi:hypothetical protein